MLWGTGKLSFAVVVHSAPLWDAGTIGSSVDPSHSETGGDRAGNAGVKIIILYLVENHSLSIKGCIAVSRFAVGAAGNAEQVGTGFGMMVNSQSLSLPFGRSSPKI